jgi:hypothetical protein
MANERSSLRSPPDRKSMLGEMPLLATLAVGILLLHFVVGALFQPGSSGAATPEKTGLHSTD